MSFDNDIMFNVDFSQDSMQQGGLSGKQKKKEFSRKMQGLKTKGFLGKHKKWRCHQDQTSPLNGATSTFSKRTSLPHLDSTSHDNSAPTAASTHTRPSVAVTVKEKPKVSKDSKPTPASGSSAPSVSTVVLPSKCIAIDCEMVGAGPKGSISQLARCSIVSYEGDVIYDKFINPTLPVTDYRTRWSGIRAKDLVKATPYSEARKEILKLLMGKVVIGHAIYNDFKVLGYSHPPALTRDTSKIQILNQKAGFTDVKCVSLKKLTKAIFNRDIQTGRKGHSSVEDAKASMELYKVVEEELERNLAAKSKVASKNSLQSATVQMI